MPQATFERTLPVQGQTRTRSAQSVISMWAMGDSFSRKRSLATACPESASKVSGATNALASLVIVTRTSQPAFWSPRSTSQALYAAMQPVTAMRTFVPCELLEVSPIG